MSDIVIEPHDVIGAMRRYGGGFVQALAEAFNRADSSNFAKLRASFPDYWDQYTEAARIHLQQHPGDQL